MITTLDLEHLEPVWQIEKSANAFPWSKTQLSQQLKHKQSTFGLWHEDRLIAYINIQRIFPEAEILMVAVDPKFQGKGFGRELLQQVLDQLSAENFERVFLEVRKSNQAAIRLYERLGFNQLGERKNYYPAQNGREDALIYGKELCY